MNVLLSNTQIILALWICWDMVLVLPQWNDSCLPSSASNGRNVVSGVGVGVSGLSIFTYECPWSVLPVPTQSDSISALQIYQGRSGESNLTLKHDSIFKFVAKATAASSSPSPAEYSSKG